MMHAGKPIIGVVGGIASGKSFVARLFGELGCVVIHADEQVTRAYADPDIRRSLAAWWGQAILEADGGVDRKAIAAKIFSDSRERERLEQLLHPWVAEDRRRIMSAKAAETWVRAFVWDVPLLMEVGLHEQCDAVVFVDAPRELRESRVALTRGWDGSELDRREKLQISLDKKRKIAQYIVVNTADAENSRRQVQQVLSLILANVVSAGVPRR